MVIMRWVPLLLLVSLLPRFARAADVEAAEREARVACAAGDPNKGVRILADLFAQTEDMTYVFNQGRCFQENGRPEDALVRFREYLRRAGDGDPEARKEAERFVGELDAEIARARPTPAAPPSDDGRMLRRTGLGLGSFGVVALGAGLVLSLKVKAQKRDTQDYAARPDADVRRVSDMVSTGTRLETWQWISYVTGVAALAGGATCYLLGSGRERREVALHVSLAPWGAVLEGRF
jgi:hypothetical protein